MITAIVRYPLAPGMNESTCRAHYERIAPGFGDVPGLLRKQFIWSERNVAGGVYQWRDRASAERFYRGPWLDGIRRRYGAEPEIEFFNTLVIVDNPGGAVTTPEDIDVQAGTPVDHLDELAAAKLVPFSRRTP